MLLSICNDDIAIIKYTTTKETYLPHHTILSKVNMALYDSGAYPKNPQARL